VSDQIYGPAIEDHERRLTRLERAVETLAEQVRAESNAPLAAAIDADLAAVREAREEMFAALGAYYAAVGKARWEHTVDDMATSLQRYRDLVRGES
jgi:hypothetical protein